jgi:hypothetical protein
LLGYYYTAEEEEEDVVAFETWFRRLLATSSLKEIIYLE